MSTTLRVLEVAGVIAGMTGSLLVAGRSARRRSSGFAIWILSNCALITWAVLVGAWALAAMYAFYCCTSGLGLRNNLTDSRAKQAGSNPSAVSR